jgi:neutral ceramidase
MTLLRFNGANGPIGSINWFAVHPTSMTYNNRLVSGDHKGYAEQEFEARWEPRGEADYEAPDFVAAFANSNCGDVTANLNLNNTGPGENEFETTQIIGQRQLDVAWQLFRSASDPLSGRIESVQAYVDFSSLEVDAAWTKGEGPQRTCASAYGYAFAAGSTEDGGGHPLFKEGMLQPNAMIDGIAANLFGRSPSDEIRACHLPKVVLFAPGETDPPQQAQVLPLGIARVGQLVFVVHPGEITTMAGRRVRETVAAALDTTPEWVVVAAYANDFSGYTTTHEEYLTQQYEGGHTLYGPWQLAGYQQEYNRLSRMLAGTYERTAADKAAAKAGLPIPRDLRGQVASVTIGTTHDPLPVGDVFGQVLEDTQPAYLRGSQARVAFRTGNPQNDFRNGSNTVTIERRSGDDWAPMLTDRDWSTKFAWSTDPMPAAEWPLTAEEMAAVMAGASKSEAAATPAASGEAAPAQASADASASAAPAAADEAAAPSPPPPTASRATVTWDIPKNMEPGAYRIVFHGAYRDGRDGQVRHFEAVSSRFTVR